MTIIYWVKVILDIPKLSLIKNTDDLFNDWWLIIIWNIINAQKDRFDTPKWPFGHF